MTRERELLARVLTLELWSVQEELQAEIKELLAQPESTQKPEAWILHNRDTGYKRQIATKPVEDCALFENEAWEVIPLYAALPTRDPLSDKEIAKNTPKLIHIGERLAFHAGVWFAEKYHGIGGGE